MQILVMVFFLLVWLLVLWIGAMMLESTGLERSRSRFQALSALSGTGFTTSQAEDVVENPHRRKIVSCLIFLGNAGILSFLVVLVLYLRQGLTLPSIASIVITVIVLLLLALLIWSGLLDKITALFVKMMALKKRKSGIVLEKVIYRFGDTVVAILMVGKDEGQELLSEAKEKLKDRGVTVLGVERCGEKIVVTQADFRIEPGDSILCHGQYQAFKHYIQS